MLELFLIFLVRFISFQWDEVLSKDVIMKLYHSIYRHGTGLDSQMHSYVVDLF